MKLISQFNEGGLEDLEPREPNSDGYLCIQSSAQSISAGPEGGGDWSIRFLPRPSRDSKILEE